MIELPKKKPETLKELRDIISQFSIYAKVLDDGTVSVENGVGNGLYLARSPFETQWLTMMATHIERQGFLTLYHFEGLK